MDSTEMKFYGNNIVGRDLQNLAESLRAGGISESLKWILSNRFYVEKRTFIYETTDKNMKFIENAALYILALNSGIIVYSIAQYKPIFNDFRTNHGAKNANGERNGKPRNQLCLLFGSEKFIGLNRFIILMKFLSKIIIPFVDSITGKSNRQTVNHRPFMIPYNHKLIQEFIISFITVTLRTGSSEPIDLFILRQIKWSDHIRVPPLHDSHGISTDVPCIMRVGSTEPA